MKDKVCIIFFLFVLLSCKEKKEKKILINSTGNISQIIVVSPYNKNDTVSKTIYNILTEEIYGLPQSEPMFDPIIVDKKNFVDFFHHHNKILILEKNSSKHNIILQKAKNVWANNQYVMKIIMKNKNELLQNLPYLKNKIYNYFLKSDRELQKLKWKKLLNEKLSKIIYDKFHLNLTIPKSYFLASEDSNSIWIRSEREKITNGLKNQISIGILIYSSNLFTTDDSLSLNLLNQILKEKIKGKTANNYMTVYKKYPLKIINEKYNNKNIISAKGLWKMENDFMGGPFSLIIFKNNLIYAYVFAPAFNKRQYIRELETIIYSFL